MESTAIKQIRQRSTSENIQCIYPSKKIFGKKEALGHESIFRFLKKSEHSSPAKYSTLGNEGSCSILLHFCVR